MIKDVGFIPDKVIEHKAYRLLTDFEVRFGKIARPPIPINKIIERHLELRFDWDDIEDTDEEKILAYLDPAERKICINTRRRDHFDQFVGSEAFTQAHEVGHWELHVIKNGETQLEFSFFKSVQQYVCREKSKTPKEFQADKFAAYLLMPYHLVMQAIEGIDLTQYQNLYPLTRTSRNQTGFEN